MDELKELQVPGALEDSDTGLMPTPEVEAVALSAAEAEDNAAPLERLAAGNRRLRAALAASSRVPGDGSIDADRRGAD